MQLIFVNCVMKFRKEIQKSIERWTTTNMSVTPSFKLAVDDIFVHLRNIKNEMNSETQNASRYRTRKENGDKQNRDSTKDKELTIMKMDHNEFDCIKDNSSSLAPGPPRPKSLSELQAIPNGSYFEWRFI